MRPFLLLALLVSLAACGTSQAAKPTILPAPTPYVQPGAKFKSPPPKIISVNHRYIASVVTSDGTFTITLLPKVAPVAVNSFVFLAQHHFFDHDLIFRIVKGFIFQTGDPTGTGFGGPGYLFKDEKVTMPYTPGTVAMANSGPNTNGSQFFVVVGPQGRSLKPKYTIFGRVSSGISVVYKIANTPVTLSPSGEPSQPLVDVVVKSVTIHES